MIFQILTSWSNCHIIHALKYQRSTTIGCKDLKIRQSEFVASVQFPFPDIYKVPHICNTFISIWFLGTCRIKYLYFRIKYLYSRIIYICTSGLYICTPGYYISVLQDYIYLYSRIKYICTPGLYISVLQDYIYLYSRIIYICTSGL